MCCTTRENLFLKYSMSEKFCFISNGDTFETTLSHSVKIGSMDYSLEVGSLTHVTFAVVHLRKRFCERINYLKVMERPASKNFEQRFSEAESGCHCARIHCCCCFLYIKQLCFIVNSFCKREQNLTSRTGQ